MIKHISIFMPSENSFHKRIFMFLYTAFKRQGLEVTGCCKLLSEEEMRLWVREKKPCAIFEMNRVKDEISILDELKVLHISWVVDMEGRGENQIKGSDITYAFDPGWVDNFNTGGFLAWMPPGTCPETFFLVNNAGKQQVDFSFIGHIPKPWSNQELSRTISGVHKNISFEMLLKYYSEYMLINTYCEQTHDSCAHIINRIVSELLGHASELNKDMYYDLLIRIKRMSNRTKLIDFALRHSDSLAIYGSENWRIWSKYKRFYKYFVESPNEINVIHQKSKINLHDGVGFHFRAIDCMASGGLLMWYIEGEYDSYEPGQVIYTRGLADFFQAQFNYFEFKWLNFDEVYDEAKRFNYQGSIAQQETLKIIKSHHTWDCRVKQIMEDIAAL